MPKKLVKIGKKYSKILAISGLVLIFLLSRKSMIKVETAKVIRGEIVETISSSGKIDAGEKADLTFQTSGRVVWVGVKKGDQVSQWQGIASLDTVVLNAAYQQTLNNYRSLEAAAQKAEDDVKDHAGDETFAQKATRMAAQVARDNAYDAVKAAEQNLKFAVIVAPFKGIITEANPSFPGINVLPSSALYSIVNPETFYFSTEVGESEISKIKAGQKVGLTLDAYPDEKFESNVENISLSSVMTSTGGTAYKVKIALLKKEGIDFRLGMNGDAEIVVKTYQDILSVPSDAVVEEDSGNFVWVVEGRKAKKVKVELGASSLDQNEIKSGLKEGDLVIVRPPTNLKNGNKISR